MKGLTHLERLIASDTDVELLFDTGEIEHACELLLVAPVVAAAGLPTFVIAPVQKVIDNLYENGDGNSAFLLSAIRLLESVQNICQIINGNLERDVEITKELSEILSDSWFNFTRLASANRIWSDLREKISTNIAKSKLQAERRLGKGTISNSSKDRVKKLYDARVKNGEKYGAIKALAYQFGYSEATIKTIIKSRN